MRLSADLSHYVVDREMMQPISADYQAYVDRILERSDSFQGAWRTAARCNCRCISRSIASGSTRSWTGGAAVSPRGDGAPRRDQDCIFLCELGPRDYAITDANGEELSDRWSEALLLKQWAAACWEAASDRRPCEARGGGVTPRP